MLSKQSPSFPQPSSKDVASTSTEDQMTALSFKEITEFTEITNLQLAHIQLPYKPPGYFNIYHTILGK